MIGRNLLLAGMAVLAGTGAAAAHHSMAMFDQDHLIELAGTVEEFGFTSPHTLILLQVKGKDARPVTWRLEGNSPNSLAWDGWSSKALKPGDQVRIIVEPLRSGAPGGRWI